MTFLAALSALSWTGLPLPSVGAGELPFDPEVDPPPSNAIRRVVAHHHNFTYKQDNLDGADPQEWWNRAMTDGFSLIGGIPCDGGGVRSRPYPLPPMDPATYQVDRWKPELLDFRAAGVDMIFVNMQPVSGSGGTRRERLLEALAAAQQVGGITIAINFDLTSAIPPLSPAEAAQWAAAHAFNHAAYARSPSGRVCIGAFLGSDQADEAAWLKGFIEACEVQGTPAAFLPTSNYNRDETRADFAALGVDMFPGYGGWGNSRSTAADASGEADAAGKTGRFYLWPVRPGDFRIKGATYVWDEPAGPLQFINQWTRAVAYKTPLDPLWVQLITGTDQFEGTAVWPTTGANFLWMDLTAWFSRALKTGTYPEIARDCVMYCHRRHHHTLRGRLDRHSWAYPHNNVTPESRIHAVVFAREAATLEIDFAGATQSFPVPGGTMTVVSHPFSAEQTGVPRFRLVRSGAAVVDILSRFPIVDAIDFTDPEYKGGSSLRRGTYAQPKPAQIRVPEGDGAAQLVNLSSRGIAADGEGALIGGFVMAGPPGARKPLLVRAVAATLRNFAVDGVLRKPRLTLFDAERRVIAVARTQDTYDGDGTVRAFLAESARLAWAFPLLPQAGRGLPSLAPSGDVAVLVSLPPGLYTALVAPDTDTLPDPPGESSPASDPRSGVVLLELYDLAPGNGAMLLNMSCRATVEPGNRQLIIGLVMAGGQQGRLLLRSVGPGLAAFGVNHPLEDPRLTVHDQDGAAVGSNDDWTVSSTADQAVEIGEAVGAFPLVPESADGALVLRLPTALFSMVISPGQGEPGGTALGEAYIAP